MSDRWTVRGVDPEALDMFARVRNACGQTSGALLSDAIRTWYWALPQLDTEEDIVEPLAVDRHLRRSP